MLHIPILLQLADGNQETEYHLQMLPVVRGVPCSVFKGFFFDVAALPGGAWYNPTKYDLVVKLFSCC